MYYNRLFSMALFSLGLTALAALPASARPEIASGDRLLTTSPAGCLSRADAMISDLGVASDTGQIDRTGYFEDGTFRILCYGAGEQSMAVIFATHNDSKEVATSFVRMALERLSSPSAQTENLSQP